METDKGDEQKGGEEVGGKSEEKTDGEGGGQDGSTDAGVVVPTEGAEGEENQQQQSLVDVEMEPIPVCVCVCVGAWVGKYVSLCVSLSVCVRVGESV